MSAGIDRHLELLEGVAMRLLQHIGDLRRDFGELTVDARSINRLPVEAEVLDRLADQLGSPDAARAVVRSYIDSLPARVIAVSVSEHWSCGERECGATAELRLASELVGAMAMAIWCCERSGEPPLTITLEGLELWLTGSRDDADTPYWPSEGRRGGTVARAGVRRGTGGALGDRRRRSAVGGEPPVP